MNNIIISSDEGPKIRTSKQSLENTLNRKLRECVMLNKDQIEVIEDYKKICINDSYDYFKHAINSAITEAGMKTHVDSAGDKHICVKVSYNPVEKRFNIFNEESDPHDGFVVYRVDEPWSTKQFKDHLSLEGIYIDDDIINIDINIDTLKQHVYDKIANTVKEYECNVKYEICQAFRFLNVCIAA